MKDLSNALHAIEAQLMKAEEDDSQLALAHADIEKEVIELRTKNGQLKALQDKILDDHVREKTMLAMCNIKLTFILATNESQQLQRELKKVCVQFGNHNQCYFGLTSWPLLEDMFLATLPHRPGQGNKSIDWNRDPSLEFQYTIEQ